MQNLTISDQKSLHSQLQRLFQILYQFKDFYFYIYILLSFSYILYFTLKKLYFNFNNNKYIKMSDLEQKDQMEIQDQQQPIMFGGSDQQYQNQILVSKQSSYTSSNPYKIVEGMEIYDQLQKNLEDINQIIAKGKDWALIFYHYYNWNLEKCKSDYFQHQNEVLEKTFYTNQKFIIDQNKKQICGVCGCSSIKYITNICKHRFCFDCWKDYIIYNIGQKVVFFKCMQQGCKFPILHQLINKVLEQGTQSQRFKYIKSLTEKFVETNSTIKFCPGADCKFSIQTDNKLLKYVQCKCGHKFCFKCKGEVHRPCDCRQVKKWLDIVLKQEANAKWLTLNTKVCPFCQKHVERSTGCNFMACAPPGGCGKSFCYVCSRPWQPDHKDHFRCNIYKPGQKQQEQKEKEKNILAKINFYCEKYLTNQQAKIKLKILVQRSGQFQIQLFNMLGIQLNQSQFVVNAYRCVMQSCDILKWSYAYSFFFDDKLKKAKQLFEFKQGQFQRYKQNLTFKLETKFKAFIQRLTKEYKANQLIQKEPFRQQFYKIKQQIVTYYKYAEQYMQQLADMVQNGQIYS